MVKLLHCCLIVATTNTWTLYRGLRDRLNHAGGLILNRLLADPLMSDLSKLIQTFVKLKIMGIK